MESSRKKRPLQRDLQVYRDDRLYIIATDDTYGPEQYFSGYKQDFLGKRIQFVVIPTTDGSSHAQHVLNRLLEYECDEGDERWLVLDTDHFIRGSHRKSFLQALRDAQQKGVRIAISCPCLEFWLLTHHFSAEEISEMTITNAQSILPILEDKLEGFSKLNIPLKHFPLEKVVAAIVTSRKIDATVTGGHTPVSPTSRVYKIWESIIQNASPAQLPLELLALK